MVTVQAEGGVGGTGAESRTVLTIFFLSHSPSSLKDFKQYINTHKLNTIILEESRDPDFERMLDGKISVEKYTLDRRKQKDEKTILLVERYQFIKEVHRVRGISIEQCEPFDDEIVATGKESARLLDYTNRQKNFEKAVDETIEYARAYAKWTDLKETKRAGEIANNVKTGAWEGDILVEAGANHTRLERLIKNQLKNLESVKVKHVHPLKDIASFHFSVLSPSQPFPGSKSIMMPGIFYDPPLIELYTPLNELGRRYIHKVAPDMDRERLTAARWLVFDKINIMTANDTNFKYEKKMYQSVKMLDQLSYRQCEWLFNLLRDSKMDANSAFDAIKKQFEMRRESDIPWSPPGEMEFRAAFHRSNNDV